MKRIATSIAAGRLLAATCIPSVSCSTKWSSDGGRFPRPVLRSASIGTPSKNPCRRLTFAAVTPALSAIVLKCLEKVPEHRFSSFVELSAALGEYCRATGRHHLMVPPVRSEDLEAGWAVTIEASPVRSHFPASSHSLLVPVHTRNHGPIRSLRPCRRTS